MDTCYWCDRKEDMGGVYTDDGLYLCAHCCDIIIRAAEEEQDG